MPAPSAGKKFPDTSWALAVSMASPVPPAGAAGDRGRTTALKSAVIAITPEQTGTACCSSLHAG
jgi:hypothetical protein